MFLRFFAWVSRPPFQDARAWIVILLVLLAYIALRMFYDPAVAIWRREYSISFGNIGGLGLGSGYGVAGYPFAGFGLFHRLVYRWFGGGRVAWFIIGKITLGLSRIILRLLPSASQKSSFPLPRTNNG